MVPAGLRLDHSDHLAFFRCMLGTRLGTKRMKMLDLTKIFTTIRSHVSEISTKMNDSENKENNKTLL